MRSGLPWLSVLTCPARPMYLEATIAAIDAAGGDHFAGTKVVCVDGDPVALAPLGLASKLRAKGWAVGPAHASGQTQGPARSMLSILGAAAVDNAPHLLYFEDDVIMCRNAVHAMGRLQVPRDFWALVFCDLKRIGGPLVVNRAQTDHHWGNQALKIPRWTLDRAATASFDIMADHPRGNGSDVFLGRIGTTPETPFFGIVAPSIVQHVGAASLCNPNRELSEYGRCAGNFPGVDFDARNLVGDQ